MALLFLLLKGDRSNLYLNDAKVIIYQNIILAILLIAVFIYMNNKNNMKQFKIENSLLCIIIGMGLGTISSFLSIGGGTVNVCVLTLFFSMNAKEAAVNYGNFISCIIKYI
ncbi:TSUP family transporter [Clostridium sp.]|uniref:TSUP family transporter n=1 Tax=Clostridium sp. TaxID=1506 RepID=UPI00341372E0